MDKFNNDSDQDNSIDKRIQELCGFSDEALLAEFEAAKAEADKSPAPAPEPGEFEAIWSRIQAENSTTMPHTSSGKVMRRYFGWKRLAAAGLIACMLAGSGSLVVMGTKSYFFREKELEGGNGSVLVNDFYKAEVNGEEEAYTLIEEELGIEALKLGYIPEEMDFSEFVLRDGYASIEFIYNDSYIYLVESKFNKKASYGYKTDSENEIYKEVYNKWLKQEVAIKQETLPLEGKAYETNLVLNGSSYRLYGTIDEKIFCEIVESLMFFD